MPAVGITMIPLPSCELSYAWDVQVGKNDPLGFSLQRLILKYNVMGDINHCCLNKRKSKMFTQSYCKPDFVVNGSYEINLINTRALSSYVVLVHIAV
jgi:hypothetical protein